MSKHILKPVKPYPGRTDYSASAVVHIKRELGVLPARSEVRKRRGRLPKSEN